MPRAVEAGLGGKGRGRAHVGLGRARVWAVQCGEKERGERAGLMRELGRGVGCWAGLLAGLGWFTGFWASFLFPISFLLYFLFDKLSYNYLNSNLNLNSTLTLKQIK